MKQRVLMGVCMACLMLGCAGRGGTDGGRLPIVFASFGFDGDQLADIALMAESIRTFGGAYRDAPIWVFVPAGADLEPSDAVKKLGALGAKIHTSETPAEASWYYFAEKVFAAGRAEAAAEGVAARLAWLDTDTIMLQEPDEFILPKGKSLGYRPVMHKNVGLLWSEPLDSFWTRVYERNAVDQAALFPMVTPADADTIRPYFNAGCLVVRPERGTLRRWGDYFTQLYTDDRLRKMCEDDVKKRIFIHQTALTGAILNHLSRDELQEFSDRINYPIFFDQVFGARKTFNDITDVVTFRHESYFRDPAPDWESRLKGSAQRIAWLKEHLTD